MKYFSFVIFLLNYYYLYGLTGGQYEVRTGVRLESVEHFLPPALSLSQPQHRPQVPLDPAGPEGEDDRGDDGVAVGGGDGEVVQPGWGRLGGAGHCAPEETDEVGSPGEANHHQYQHCHTCSSPLLSASTIQYKYTKFDIKRFKGLNLQEMFNIEGRRDGGILDSWSTSIT